MGKKTQSCGSQYPHTILSSAQPMDMPYRMMQRKRMRSPQNEALSKPEGRGPPLSKIRRGNPPCSRGSGRRSGDVRALSRAWRIKRSTRTLGSGRKARHVTTVARRIKRCTGTKRWEQGAWNRERGHRPSSARHRTIGGRARGSEGQRVRNRRNRVVRPGPKEGTGALWVPTKGQRAGREFRRKRSKRVRSGSSRRRKNRQRRQSTSIHSRHDGKSGTCSGALWLSSAGGASSEALAKQASEACAAQRAAWALSSGSTTSRATGVTSEEPAVEGTRGEPIGVAILSVARPNTGPNLV